MESPEFAQVPAPAKINLFLRVVGQRPDGYHQLNTLFSFLDYGDTLHFTRLESQQVTRVNGLPGVSDEQDLCVRAARLLQSESGTRQGVAIGLHKQIPMGGGLGGGSSDAATTLLALNRLWGLGWHRGRLAALGLRLGADVPVFIGGQAAFAEGIGEQLTPVQVPEDWYLVAHPGIGVSTREIFSAPDLTRNSIPVKMHDFSAVWGQNDLQPVVVKRYPQVARLLECLGQWGTACMSGSGACCFVAFGSEEAARSALFQLPPEYEGFVARGMNRHPLRDWV